MPLCCTGTDFGGGLWLGVGTNGYFLRAPRAVPSESHAHLMPLIDAILKIRMESKDGEAGAPRSIVTDNTLRDSDAFNSLLLRYFPATQKSSAKTVIVQDIVHRRYVSGSEACLSQRPAPHALVMTLQLAHGSCP
jgi:hypothetical protein